MTLIGIEPHAAMFIEPARLAPSAWTGHVPFAAWLTAVSRPDVFVELGTQAGMSYAAFCQTVQAQRLPTRCYAVDTWEGDAHCGAYGEEVYQDFMHFNAQHFASFSVLLRARFDDAVASFENGSVDLLHIDGLHTYEAVRHDFETWRPKLSTRATVLFHDTAVRSMNFGVWRYWSEIAPAYPHFAFDHASGLGVLQVGKHMPAELRQLYEVRQDAERAQCVKDVFSALGDALVRRYVQENTSYPQLNARSQFQSQSQSQPLAASFELQARALAAMNQALAQRLAESEAALQRLIGSFSWRVTQPLRVVRGLFN